MPGIREERILRSNVGFMALHGGFAGPRHPTRSPEGQPKKPARPTTPLSSLPALRVHLTSRLHNPDDSAHLRSFLEHVDVAISVHGFGRDGFALWLDPERGVVIEPYGPAMRGGQTGTIARDHRGRFECAELVEAARAALPGAFRRLPRRRRAGAARVSSRPTRSTFHRLMASKSSCRRACAESATSASIVGAPPGAASSARWWLRSSNWRHAPPNCCARRRCRPQSFRAEPGACPRMRRRLLISVLASS